MLVLLAGALSERCCAGETGEVARSGRCISSLFTSGRK